MVEPRDDGIVDRRLPDRFDRLHERDPQNWFVVCERLIGWQRFVKILVESKHEKFVLRIHGPRKRHGWRR